MERQLRVDPLLLHLEWSQPRWCGHLIGTPPGGGVPVADPDHAGGIIYVSSGLGTQWSSPGCTAERSWVDGPTVLWQMDINESFRFFCEH